MLNLEELKQEIQEIEDLQYRIERLCFAIQQNSLDIYRSVGTNHVPFEEIENAIKPVFEKHLEKIEKELQEKMKKIKEKVLIK